MISPPTQELLERTRQRFHPLCVVCGRPRPSALGLEFRLLADGGVTAEFDCSDDFEGYGGILHGGVAATLLDSAMTNCLFAHGIAAVTAEMIVRFRHPIELGVPVTAQAHIAWSQTPLHILEAQIVQGGRVKAKATGKFMERHRSTGYVGEIGDRGQESTLCRIPSHIIQPGRNE